MLPIRAAHGEAHKKAAVGRGHLYGFHEPVIGFQNAIDFSNHLIGLGADGLVGHVQRLEVKTRLQNSQQTQRHQNAGGGKNGQQHETGAGSHSDGSDNKKRSRRCKTLH